MRLESECVVVAQRGRGQDRAAIRTRDNKATLVLADGAGGGAGGAEAAEISLAAALEQLELTDAHAPEVVVTNLDRVLLAARDAGETTLIAAKLRGRELVGASVGDSGAWLIDPSGYRDLTAHQSRKPMLGSGDAQVTSFSAVLGSETLLIASDGLLNFAPANLICEIVRNAPNLQVAGTQLVDSVRLRSGTLPDDVSVVLLKHC